MATGRERVVSSLIFYTVAIGSVTGVNFLTTPLLIHLLPTDQFYIWALAEPVVVSSLALAGFGIQLGLIRRLGRGDDSRAIASLWPFYLAATGLVAGGGGLVWLTFGNAPLTAFLIAGSILFEGIIVFVVTIWRAQYRAGLYAAMEASRSWILLAFVSAGALLIIPLAKADDYLVLRCLVFFVAAAIGLLIVRPRFMPVGTEARVALSYGMPIVLASLMAAVLTSLDRYALALPGSATAVAIYVAHVRLSQAIGSAVSPFYAWLAPRAIQDMNSDHPDLAFLARAIELFVVGVVTLTAIVWVLSAPIWQLLFPSIPLERVTLAILLASSAIYAAGNPVSIAVLKDGKTPLAMAVTGASLVVGATVCFALAEPFGTVGVAIGRGAGLIVYSGLFYMLTAHAMPTLFRHGRMAGFVVSITVALLAFEVVPGPRNGPVLFSQVALLLLLAAIFAIRALRRP